MMHISRKYALIGVGFVLVCITMATTAWASGHPVPPQPPTQRSQVQHVSTKSALSLKVPSHPTSVPTPGPTSAPKPKQAPKPKSTPTPTSTRALSPATAAAQESPEMQLPSDAVINVKTAYGAVGDGVTDDTAALQKAISENLWNTLYLPAGTYLVSNRLEAKDTSGNWQGGFRLWGENRDTTIIKLQDNAAGFGDPQQPRAVLYPASGNYDDPSHPSDGYLQRGEGNMAFNNYIQNLTVDTGNNRGAIGIDYLGSNVGAVRKVTIRGQGVTGLSMTRAWPGPALISQVSIDGFDEGIHVAQGQYGLTLEHILLTGQNQVGLLNVGNILAIRDLTSTNSVPAVRNSDATGFITLVEATLDGGADGVSAIENTGELMARQITTSGYQSAIQNKGTVIPGSSVNEFTSHDPYSIVPDAASTSLNLPVQDTPEFDDNNMDDWANVLNYGAQKDDWGDDTAGIQAAIDSGKSVLYFPAGRYFVSDTLHIRGNIHKIVGFNATLAPFWGAFTDGNNPKGFFEIDDGTAPNVIFSGVGVGQFYNGAPKPAGLIGFEHLSSRPLVLQDMVCCGDYKWAYHSGDQAGPLFIENVSASRWQFVHPQQIWARQFNPEDQDVRMVNNGATVWILGFKTEQHGRIFLTEGGGQTELLGGAIYEAGSPTDVAFECIDAHMSLSFATMAYDSNTYAILAQETRNGVTTQFARDQAVWRGDGKMVPLYVD